MRDYAKEINEKLNSVREKIYNDELTSEGNRMKRKMYSSGDSYDPSSLVPELLELSDNDFKIVFSDFSQIDINNFNQQLEKMTNHYNSLDGANMEIWDNMATRCSRLSKRINNICIEDDIKEYFTENKIKTNLIDDDMKEYFTENKFKKDLIENGFEGVRKERFKNSI